MSLLKRAIEEELRRRRRESELDPKNRLAILRASREASRAGKDKPTLSEKLLKSKDPIKTEDSLAGKRYELVDNDLVRSMHSYPQGYISRGEFRLVDGKYPLGGHAQAYRAGVDPGQRRNWIRDNYTRIHEYPPALRHDQGQIPARLKSAISKLKKLRGK